MAQRKTSLWLSVIGPLFAVGLLGCPSQMPSQPSPPHRSMVCAASVDEMPEAWRPPSHLLGTLDPRSWQAEEAQLAQRAVLEGDFEQRSGW